MGKLSVISGKGLIQVLESFGWIEVRRKSSHIILVKSGEIVTLSVPDHKEIAKGTLRSLLRIADISIEDYNAALND